MESNTNTNTNTNTNPITETLDPLYVDINPENPVSEIESLCMNCEKNGTTRILLTKIPFFKEIILMILRFGTDNPF